MKKKKSTLTIVLTIVSVLLIAYITFIIKKMNNKEPQDSESQAQMIEVEGDLEIIIPEDQESDGF